ncbi:hypothetical protein Pyn_18793 [Prunus yedoensis var. nudiflora]|uniref:Uncharacterized protein n=1 Tax=Prunus yedoensis var. nudiflora TaxID=2094558 RepID=A0A314ZN86_PRUYE|nr:hypothetical protein Pyn_18793 [Prunus yedoensis var. nudiflora]
MGCIFQEDFFLFKINIKIRPKSKPKSRGPKVIGLLKNEKSKAVPNPREIGKGLSTFNDDLTFPSSSKKSQPPKEATKPGKKPTCTSNRQVRKRLRPQNCFKGPAVLIRRLNHPHYGPIQDVKSAS